MHGLLTGSFQIKNHHHLFITVLLINHQQLTVAEVSATACSCAACFIVVLVVTMAASALLKSRCRRPSYLKKLAKAEDLIDLFPHGSYIGWSGFTGVGYPK
jgi:hypothetical protein